LPGERTAVVKSTVPPGSVERWNNIFGPQGLHVIFNPEFLREATALDDMRNQDRIILGGPRPWINEVRNVFQSAFPTVPIFKTSSTNAEMVKYVINTFLATKVSFANEIYQICESIADLGQDCDYDRVIELATLDKRLGNSHWKVPSFEVDENGQSLKGYSLSCYPKDVNALITLAKKLEVDPKVLSAGWQKNLEVRPSKDWEKLFGRAVSKKS
jgi:UDPglucose 6-dehydrogenase